MRPHHYYARDSEREDSERDNVGIVLLEDALQIHNSNSISDDDHVGIVLYDPLDSNNNTPTYEPNNNPRVVKNDPVGYYDTKSNGQRESSATTHQSPTFRYRSDSQSTGASSVGAIRPGGAIHLFDRHHIGLWYNFLNVGFITGMAQSIGYPVFFMYFHLQPFQQQAASALITFSWSLRFIIGFLSDCFPIQRQRRRPYMLIGTILQFIVAVTCMVMPKIEPFFKDGQIHNLNASNESPRFVIATTISGITSMIMATSADGMLVDYSLRESEFERGKLYMQLTMTYFIGGVFSTLLVALGCNSDQYGGSFSFSIPPNALFGILAIPTFVGIFITYYYLDEELVNTTSQPFYSHMRAIYRLVERKATWYLSLFVFCHGFCYAFVVPTQDLVYFFWLKGDSLSRALFYTITQAMLVIGLLFFQTDRLRNTSWRTIVAVSTVFSTIVGITTMYVTVFDIYRQKYLYLTHTAFVAFCGIFVHAVRMLAVIEIAEPRYESTTYALMTTLLILSGTWGVCVSNAVSAGLGLSAATIPLDSKETRWEVMKDYIVMYSIRFGLGLSLLVLLPRQKREMRKLIQQGSPNLIIPMVLAVVFVIIFLVTWTSLLLSMFKSTACLKFAGGPGCV